MKLSDYVMDSENGIVISFHSKPPQDVPEWDKIKILFVRNGYGTEFWIHEEEALSIISGLSAGVVEIMKRKPIREDILKKQYENKIRDKQTDKKDSKKFG